MYQIRALTAVKKDLKRLDKPVRAAIEKDHFPAIQNAPDAGDVLHQDLEGLRSYHFSQHGTQYRIVYEVHVRERLVVVLMIGTRENFYERVRRRLRPQ